MSRLLELQNRIAKVTTNLQPVAKSFDLNAPFDIRTQTVHEVVTGQDLIDGDRADRHNEHYIHVSDLLELCPRAYVIAVRHTERNFKSDFLSGYYPGATQIVRKMGRACEEHIRTQFIKRYAGQVLGNWVCPCKSSKYHGVFNPAIRCLKCHGGHKYKEVPLLDHDLRIIGNSDLPIICDDEVVYCEIKSIKKDEFDKLTCPQPAHLSQVFAYNDMAKKQRTRKISRYVKVIYAAKDFVKTVPYKEYLIDTEDDAYRYVRATLDILYAKARIIRDSLRNKTIPSRLDKCSSITESKAKSCPVCVNCFSLPNEIPRT